MSEMVLSGQGEAVEEVERIDQVSVAESCPRAMDRLRQSQLCSESGFEEPLRMLQRAVGGLWEGLGAGLRVPLNLFYVLFGTGTLVIGFLPLLPERNCKRLKRMFYPETQ